MGGGGKQGRTLWVAWHATARLIREMKLKDSLSLVSVHQSSLAFHPHGVGWLTIKGV